MMKRLVFIPLLMLTVAVSAQAVADSAAKAASFSTDTLRMGSAVNDSVRRSSQPLNGGSSHRRQSGNVIGSPIYYDVPTQRQAEPQEGEYRHRPMGGGEQHRRATREAEERGRNPYERYSSVFFEVSTDFVESAGFNFAVVPDEIGGYVDVRFGYRYPVYFGLGPVLRLSGENSSVDWHLYGGLLFAGRKVGFEAGLRLAAPALFDNGFCWNSLSLGYSRIGRFDYVVFGISLNLVDVMDAIFWLY